MRWRPRKTLEESLLRAVGGSPVTLLVGPRQCGKTTLARRVASRKKAVFFDLEDPGVPLQKETLGLALRGLRGLVVIDECQREPALFPLLRVLADRRPLPARFLLLGSAAPDLVRGASESLAGRVRHVDMGGFTLDETGTAATERLWLRGGMPMSFLARSEEESFRWRLDFARAHLERDIPALGIRIPSAALRRFWMMLAHVHAQTWNSSDLARSLGTQEDTVRRYLDILTGSFMIRQLQPWFENVGKRLVKAPKIYFRDSGLLHAFLGLQTRRQLMTFPRLGFSWEGFVLEQIIQRFNAERDAYFYKTHAGAELDLMIQKGGRRYGFEIKYADAPTMTRSMHVVVADLGLKRLWVVHPGTRRYELSSAVEAIPLADIESLKI